MQNFDIATRGLALAVDMVVHPSILTKGKVMECFLVTKCLYEEYDAQLHVQEAVQMFKEGITLYYTRLMAYLEGTEGAAPPRIMQVLKVLKQRI